MAANSTLNFNHMLKKSIISCAMIGVVTLALASSGGGGGKKKSVTPLSSKFTPIRTTNGFTLKAGAQYTGSQIYSSERNHNFVTYNTLVTYQKGNTVYILPNKVTVNTRPQQRSNLNLLDLRIRLHK